MTEQKAQLEQQLWNIANTLRGKMDAALDKLGYFLLPSELLSELARRGNEGGKQPIHFGLLSQSAHAYRAKYNGV